MKILVLDEFLCYPVDSGKKVRTYNLLKNLASRHSITLLAFVWGDQREQVGIEHLSSLGIKVVTVPRTNPSKSGLAFYTKLFANLFSSQPYIVAGHVSTAYRERLSSLIVQLKPDILLAEWSPYAIYLEQYRSIPRAAVAHNLESSIWRGYLEKSETFARRKYIGLQYEKVLRFENRIFGWLDGLITVSPLELEVVRKSHPKLRATLVDNGVDTEFFCPSDRVIDDKLISFTGSMDWRPNQDAIDYFIHSILPLVRKQEPDVKTLIIGRQPPKWLVDLGARHGVEFTGSVDDVRPFVHRSAVSIVPLRIGGGSRLKILEALSMEKAVVSTMLGAEGLDVMNNEQIVIADAPDQFADAIVALLRNKSERARLGTNGRKLVTNKYRWENLAAVQSAFLESLVHG